MTGKRGRRRNQLLYYGCETRGYWKLKEEAMDRNLWSTHFGKGYGPVVKRLENESMNIRNTETCFTQQFQVLPTTACYVVHRLFERCTFKRNPGRNFDLSYT